MPQWTHETIATAVAAWSRSKGSDKPLSLREVSKLYNIPRETLRSYVRGQAVGSRAGPPAALSAQEEDGLVEGLIERHAKGFPATRQQLKVFVLDIVRDGRAHRFGATGPSDKWVAAFLERHKNRISVRKARILDANRVDAFDGDAISCFFAEYQDYLNKHDLPATRIYNCDETGVDPQGGSPSKVIARRGAKNVAVKRGANRENTSILMTVSAAGGVVPPLFIYKGKRLRSDLLSGAPPGSKATVTESAFIDSVTFEAWIDHFVENIPPARPVLLLLDNHASHVAIEVLEKCRVNKIDVLSLPPHATHLMQPLDAGCFRSFKSEWRKCIANFAAVTNGANVQKHHIAALTREAIDAAWGPRIISTSWSSTGMWPVNPDKVLSKPVLSRNLSGRSNYAGYTLIHDPLPLDAINQRSLRQLTRDGIDVNAYRAYSIIRMNMNSAQAPPAASERVFIDVTPKRLLTHDQCMAELRLRYREREEEEQLRQQRRTEAVLRRQENIRLKAEKAREREEKRLLRDEEKLRKLVLGRWKRIARAVKKIVAANHKIATRTRRPHPKLKFPQMESVERALIFEAVSIEPGAMTVNTGSQRSQEGLRGTSIVVETPHQSANSITAFCDL